MSRTPLQEEYYRIAVEAAATLGLKYENGVCTPMKGKRKKLVSPFKKTSQSIKILENRINGDHFRVISNINSKEMQLAIMHQIVGTRKKYQTIAEDFGTNYQAVKTLKKYYNIFRNQYR